MNAKRISPNIYITEDPSFGTYDETVVHRLIQQVQIDFSSWIGDDIFQTSNCIILYKKEYPMISRLPDGSRIVFLSVEGNDLWRWTYQFAHEYCHHLINGSMSGEISGLTWFEETICHLSSICHLDRLIALCDVLKIDNRTWIQSCREANFGSPQTNCPEYLKSHMDVLAQPEYQREIYSNLSATIYPLFQENNHLWKMIRHFGDTRSWTSLEDLFAHLRKTADVSYSVSLRKLESMMLI